jgi:hypothetical protein
MGKKRSHSFMLGYQNTLEGLHHLPATLLEEASGLPRYISFGPQALQPTMQSRMRLSRGKTWRE